MSVALQDAAWALRFKKTKKDSPVHKTSGSFNSPALGTVLDFQDIGHRGLPGTYLGLFWIISKSTIATPRYIGRRGVLTPRYIRP